MYTDDELKFLKGTQFLDKINDLNADLKVEYCILSEDVTNLGTFEEFCKAFFMVTSRCFVFEE